MSKQVMVSYTSSTASYFLNNKNVVTEQKSALITGGADFYFFTKKSVLVSRVIKPAYKQVGTLIWLARWLTTDIEFPID